MTVIMHQHNFCKHSENEPGVWMRPGNTLSHSTPVQFLEILSSKLLTRGVSGLLNGEGSAEWFSLSNDLSRSLCANFLFNASAIRAAGSDGHTVPLLLLFRKGVPPGDLNTPLQHSSGHETTY